ncbi:Mg2+-importing ATPase [Cupriavidus plantarum]|nr:Mg2+-importing ATPase [Cupriavidus plantarum]
MPRHSPGPPALATALLSAATLPPSALLSALGSSHLGLTDADARQRLEEVGPNEVLTDDGPQLPLELVKRLSSPLSVMLLVLSSVSLVIGDFSSAAITAAMVLLSVGIATCQEQRSVMAAKALRALVHTTATVQRRATAHADSTSAEVEIARLVPGDIVHIGAGDLVPGDLRLLTAKDLFLNQSAMTGESLPIEKSALVLPNVADATALTPGDLPNIALLGTTVVSGTGTGVVVSTGVRTVFGDISRLASQTATPSAFDTGIRHVANLMLALICAMTPLVFAINYLTKGDPFEAMLFSLAVAVGLTPEMLPMLTTVTLSKGALAMARRKVIVKQLSAIQNLGAMDILCTDKTGTLTQDCVILHRHVDIDESESDHVFALTYLNSRFQTGLRNLLDKAVLLHDPAVVTSMGLDQRYRLIDEVPFDFARRRMSVIVESDTEQLLVCKGAVEEILSVCTTCERAGAVVPLTAPVMEEAKALAARLNRAGFRLLAVAFRSVAKAETRVYAVADESGLTLGGFVAFIDPPKETAAAALRAIRGRGIGIKVLTGDSPDIARHVCGLVGIDALEIVTGRQLDGLEETAVAGLAERCTVFAKLTPEHKATLVRALRSRGHVVGVLGDGINDSPALRAADVGISVDTGTDIAKEAAAVILLEKSLLVLHDGIVEGRRVFANLLKYIRMASSSNFGNVFSVLGASLWLPFLPMAPIQLLTCNLLYDISQTAIPTDRVDDDALAQPSSWDTRVLWRYIAIMGPLSSAVDFLTFLLLYFVLDLRSMASEAAFHSSWFVESILSQMLVIYVIRTRRIPFVQSRPSAALVAATIAIVTLALWLPFSPFAPALRLVPPPSAFWLYLPLLLAVYLSGAFLARGVLYAEPRHSVWTCLANALRQIKERPRAPSTVEAPTDMRPTGDRHENR